MKEYTVEEIAAAINRNPETVRRLLRSNAIKANAPSSSKEGWRISQAALKEFLEKTPKYMTTAAAALVSSHAALPIALGGLITGVVTATILSRKKSVTAEQIKDYVSSEIKKSGQKVKQKEKQLKKMQMEMDDLKNRIETISKELDEAQGDLDSYSQALSQLNFDDLAVEINRKLKEEQ